LLLLQATELRSFEATHLLFGLADCRMPIAESSVLASSQQLEASSHLQNEKTGQALGQDFSAAKSCRTPAQNFSPLLPQAGAESAARSDMNKKH
jgi:hypothetical protein